MSSALAVEQRRGEVEHLVEDGVIRGALEHLRHLQGDGLQQAAQHAEGEGVAASVSGAARRNSVMAARSVAMRYLAHCASSTMSVPNAVHLAPSRRAG